MCSLYHTLGVIYVQQAYACLSRKLTREGTRMMSAHMHNMSYDSTSGLSGQ